MAEEALLRGVIPAIASAGHGLYEMVVFQHLYESLACIMAPLVTVDDRRIVQCAAVLRDQPVHRLQHKIHHQVPAQLIGEDLPRKRVQDR